MEFSAEPLPTSAHDPVAHLIQQFRNLIFNSKYEYNYAHPAQPYPSILHIHTSAPILCGTDNARPYAITYQIDPCYFLVDVVGTNQLGFNMGFLIVTGGAYHLKINPQGTRRAEQRSTRKHCLKIQNKRQK